MPKFQQKFNLKKISCLIFALLLSMPIQVFSEEAESSKKLSFEFNDAKESVFTAKSESDLDYLFEKSASSEYVLTLKDTPLPEGQEESLIAKDVAADIRSVRFVTKGADLQLRFFTKPNVFLQANQSKGSIVVGSALGEIAPADVMAQANEVELEGEVTGQFEESFSEGFESKYTGRLISLDLQDTDIDNALRIIAEVSNLNIIASDDVGGKVTLRLQDVPWDQALDVILKTNGLDLVREGNVVRIAPLEKLRSEREALKQAKQAEEELEPLRVQYLRISYARASELQPMIESILTERGSVAFDERTNQLIIKDITRGLTNAQKLVEKLDLRTPQVLIEAQIVEATRTFTRRLGSQLGFNLLRSPDLGNALPYNFPNSAEIGGSAVSPTGESNGNVSEFANGESSALSFLFGSSDGSKSLSFRLTQAEEEGVAKIVSRPSVAVANNTPAEIKAVRKLRIKLPAGGGVNIGVGAGAAGGGGGNVATETIEVGIVLNVTAQASPDYFVLMDIDAKSSSLGTFDIEGVPEELERSATSSVLVSSGQTFAMGGIYKIDETNGTNGIPFFKDIPVLGHFFRSATTIDSDQELLFFLTPRIIEGSFDDAALEDESEV